MMIRKCPTASEQQISMKRVNELALLLQERCISAIVLRSEGENVLT